MRRIKTLLFLLLITPALAQAEEGENTYLTRVGTSYEFEIGEMTLAPEINFDFVDGDTAFVAGVSLGWAF
jgi:hypothetical protein